MNAQQLAAVLDRLGLAITDAAADLKGQVPIDPMVGNRWDQDDDHDRGNDDQDDDGHEVDDDAPPANVVNLNQAKGPAEDAMLQVSAGDLWRLVNRSRKMIRLARQGKIPSMEGRAPLCRAIKALKAKGLVRKPHNLRD